MTEVYRDPWVDYKAVCESTRKKFLKKPNYPQALADYGSLSGRFQYVLQSASVMLCFFFLFPCNPQY